MRKYFKIFSKVTIYIVRDGLNHQMKESSPCQDCYEAIKALGIKQIVYSTSNVAQQIMKFKTEDYMPTRKTVGRRFIENNFKIPKKIKYTDGKTIYDSDTTSVSSDSSSETNSDSD